MGTTAAYACDRTRQAAAGASPARLSFRRSSTGLQVARHPSLEVTVWLRVHPGPCQESATTWLLGLSRIIWGQAHAPCCCWTRQNYTAVCWVTCRSLPAHNTGIPGPDVLAPLAAWSGMGCPCIYECCPAYKCPPAVPTVADALQSHGQRSCIAGQVLHLALKPCRCLHAGVKLCDQL